MTLSILPFPPYLFTHCLLFLPPRHRLSSPVMEVDLSPADEFMSNGCGSIFCDACSKQEAQRAAGENRGRFIWAGRPSLYHHANRDSSTEPGAPQSDKAPRQSSTAVRPHSPQWMGQNQRQYVTHNSDNHHLHTNPARSVSEKVPRCSLFFDCMVLENIFKY